MLRQFLKIFSILVVVWFGVRVCTVCSLTRQSICLRFDSVHNYNRCKSIPLIT